MNIFEMNPNKIIVAPGSGKTATLKKIVAGVLAQGDLAVIVDRDGHYTKAFYNAKRGALILNPFDKRALNWAIFGEIRSVEDILQLVYSLIPETGNAAGHERRDLMRTFMIDVMTQLWKVGNKEIEKTGKAGRYHTAGELYRVLTQEPTGDNKTPGLKKLLEGTPSATFLTDNNARMFGSIRASTASTFRFFQYLDRPGAATFAVREWVKQGKAGKGPGKGGILFIPYPTDELEMLRGMVGVWIGLALSESKKRTDNRHLLFVLDDLGSIGQIDKFAQDLAQFCRSGGRVILSIDSLEWFKTLYGDKANAILETAVIL